MEFNASTPFEVENRGEGGGEILLEAVDEVLEPSKEEQDKQLR